MRPVDASGGRWKSAALRSQQRRCVYALSRFPQRAGACGAGDLCAGGLRSPWMSATGKSRRCARKTRVCAKKSTSTRLETKKTNHNKKPGRRYRASSLRIRLVHLPDFLAVHPTLGEFHLILQPPRKSRVCRCSQARRWKTRLVRMCDTPFSTLSDLPLSGENGYVETDIWSMG